MRTYCADVIAPGRRDPADDGSSARLSRCFGGLDELEVDELLRSDSSEQSSARLCREAVKVSGVEIACGGGAHPCRRARWREPRDASG